MDRAKIAAMALQGILASGERAEPSVVAPIAVSYADALLAELRKGEPESTGELPQTFAHRAGQR